MEIKYITVNCEKCEQHTSLPFYFYDTRIVTQEDPINLEKNYTASVLGKTMCPHCGAEIRKHFLCPIHSDDIIELAIRRS